MSWGEFKTHIGAAERRESRFFRKLLRVVFIGSQASQDDVDDLISKL
jgi:hypothetical protein